MCTVETFVKCLTDCRCVLFKEFAANSDRRTVDFHELSKVVRARYIRIRPTAWRGHISMRAELLGCKGSECIVIIIKSSRVEIFGKSTLEKEQQLEMSTLLLVCGGLIYLSKYPI